MPRVVMAAAVASVLVAACGNGAPTAGTVPGTTRASVAPDGDLPPRAVADMAPLLDPLLAPLGLRLTRSALVQRPDRGGGDGGKPHLALYVEPTSTWDDARYVATIAPLARLVTPFVFDRWAGVASYDVCQEPLPGVDDRAEPPPITVFEVSRAYARTVVWGQVTLGELVRDSQARPMSDIILAVTQGLQPALAAAAGR